MEKKFIIAAILTLLSEVLIILYTWYQREYLAIGGEVMVPFIIFAVYLFSEELGLSFESHDNSSKRKRSRV